MSLITSIFLIPMQSALFGLKPASISSNLTVDAWPDLPVLKDQGLQFTGEAVNQAKSIISKNSGLPPFTTEEYAVSPLRLMTNQGGNNETWSLLARVYWSEPLCLDIPNYPISREPDHISWEPPKSTILQWSLINMSIPTEAANSTSCHLAFHGFEIKRPQMVASTYLTWNKINKQMSESPDTGSVKDQYSCAEFSFIASLCAINPVRNGINSSAIGYNVTAIAVICKSDYFSGLAKVTVWKNGSIASVDISEDHQQRVLDIGLLDINDLEDSISNDHHTDQAMSFDPLLTFVGVNTATMSSVIHASLPVSDRIDLPGFKNSIAKTYKLTSALAIARVLRSETVPGLLSNDIAPDVTLAVHSGNFAAIATSTFFAVASEVILACMTVAALLNLISYLRQGSLLRNDPDSLAAMLALVTTHFSNVTVLKELSTSIETTSTPVLKQVAAPIACHSSGKAANLLFTIRMTAVRHDEELLKSSSEQPFYLSPFGLAVSFGALFLTMAACALLLAFACMRHFTYLAESNSLASQALWQFSPTLAATIIGAVWQVVHRDLSVLEPWENLHRVAPAATSLSVNYASRTSYVVLFKAGKNRHIFLSFISFICVSTSILNVAMGSLFFQASSVIDSSIGMSDVYGKSPLPTSTTWNSTDWNMADAFELVRTNVSDNAPAPMPPWSTHDMIFLPMHFDATDPKTLSLAYNVTTVGIGASLECTSAGATQGQEIFAFGLNNTGTDPAAFNLTKYPDPASEIRLVPNPSPGLGGVLGDVQQPYDECYVLYGKEMPDGPATIFLPLTAANEDGKNCRPYLSVLDRIYKPTESNKTLYGILCWAQVHVYNASVITDANNLIQNYKLHSIMNESTSPFSNVQEHIENFMDMLLATSDVSVSKGYHGTRIGRYDWPGLLTARMRNLSHPDGVQNASILATAANRTFAQTFASFWALYSDQFLIRAPSPDKSGGTVSHQIARMVPSVPAFTVTFLLLILYIVAATTVSVKRREQVTPRIPNSIGTILPWIIHSRILKDFAGTAHLSSSLRDEFLQSLGKEYEFGWFRDEQGTVRLGLEESKYVTKAWVLGQQRPLEAEVALLEGQDRHSA